VVSVLDANHAVFATLPDLARPGDEPSHLRIERWLAELADRGVLKVGDRLPAESDLAGQLGVSRMTLRQALGALEARGVVERRRGRSGGTFVTRPRIECDLTGLSGFTEQMRRAHVRAGARVVRARLVQPAGEVARALELDHRQQVYEVLRVRSANREPLAFEETYLAAQDFPGLLDHRLTGSLYTLMRRSYGLAPYTAREWLEPALADERVGRLLGTTVGAPLMLVTRTAYTETGRPVEHAYDRYRADRTRIALRTGIGTDGQPASLTATLTTRADSRARQI
jgi:GntR family transcriptional regulator